MKRWALLLPLLLPLLLLGVVAVPTDDPYQAQLSARQPNILLILTDDMRADDLRFVPKARTLIGNEGRRFGRAYVTTSLCCPSRVTILTGRYVHSHGVQTNTAPNGGFEKFRSLGGDHSTIATRLDSVGYRTALIGKYLNGYRDVSHVPPGWDEWFATAGPVAGRRISDNGALFEREESVYHDDLLSDRAAAFVRSSREPFFLYLSVSAPHRSRPLAPPRYKARFSDLRVPRQLPYGEGDVSDKPAWVSNKDGLDTDEKRRMDAHYRNRARSLLAVDETVERLVEVLKEQGELDNTYIVFTSDNGYHMGEHRLRPGKTSAYEEDIRVPLLVRGPGVKAGTEDRFALNTDLAPTFADWAGVEMEGADGRSLAPLFSGERAPWRSAFLVEKLGNGDKYTYRGVRTETYLHVRYANGDRELYNVTRDPRQLESVHHEAAPSVMKKLGERLGALSKCAGAGCRRAEDGWSPRNHEPRDEGPDRTRDPVAH